MRPKYIMAIATAIVSMVSCSDFERMNTNPNQIPYNETNPTKLLQDLIYYSNSRIYYRAWRVNNQLMQYSTFVNGQELTANYDIKSSESDMSWKDFYKWGSAADHMYSLAIAKDDPNCQAIALTLKVYACEPITAIFGDVPYSEAFRFDEGISAPVFDDQIAIYRQMLDELETANFLYDTDEELDVPSRDLLYTGDILKWKKFTNSLRLRLLMRVSRSEEIDAPAMIEEMLRNPQDWPVFESNADAAILRPTGENPFYGVFGGSIGYDPMTTNNKLCSRFTKLLTSAADPRLPKFADARNGEYLGLDSGQTQDYISANADNCCNYAKSLNRNTTPQTMMNYAEVLFLKAEARFRDFTTVGDAGEYYDKAVTASIRQWLEDEKYEPGQLLEAPSTAAYDNTLVRIMEQKYIAVFLSGFEAWCDYRRTGLPEMPKGPAMMNYGDDGEPVLPERLVYPAFTEARNGANYADAVSRLETGRNDMLSKVRWAQGTRY